MNEKQILIQLDKIKTREVSEQGAASILREISLREDPETRDLRTYILHEQLITSPLPMVRAAAAAGLRGLHNESSTKHLRQAWVREEDSRLKNFIRKVLDELLRSREYSWE